MLKEGNATATDAPEAPEASETGFLHMLAMELFERCLEDGDDGLMIAFIERQVSDDPPPFELLNGLQRAILTRIREMRSERFKLRTRLGELFGTQAGVDVSPLFPASDAALFDELSAKALLEYALMTKSLDIGLIVSVHQRALAVFDDAEKLGATLTITVSIYTLLTDWLAATQATYGRRYWGKDTPDEVPLQ